MAVGLQVGEGEIYICPISPPSLHLPFTEADPLPEGKEGDVIIMEFKGAYLGHKRMYEWNIITLKWDVVNSNGHSLAVGTIFKEMEGIKITWPKILYGIFNITT